MFSGPREPIDDLDGNRQLSISIAALLVTVRQTLPGMPPGEAPIAVAGCIDRSHPP